MMSKYHPKNQNYPKNTIKVILTPFLIEDGNDYLSGITVHSKNRAADRLVDQLIDERVRADYTNVKDILGYGEYKVIDYEYSKPNIILTVRRKDGNIFKQSDIDVIVNTVNPYDGGPDTWMEGDITIIEHKDLAPVYDMKKLYGSDCFELAVEVTGFQ